MENESPSIAKVMIISPTELRFETRSAEQTEAIGAAVGRRLRAGDVLALSGDLGAGKTCFVRGLARGLNIRGPVASPTFVLINEHRGRVRLYHVDLYRIHDPIEAAEIGIEELLPSEDGVTAIEWAERIDEWIPAEAVRIRIEIPSPESRLWKIAGGVDLTTRIRAALGETP